MGRLFWKIFLWFWVAMLTTVLGIVWVMAQLFFPLDGQRNNPVVQNFERRLEPQIQQLISSAQQQDISTITFKLQRLAQRSPLTLSLINSQGFDVISQLKPNFDNNSSLIKQLQIITNKGDIYQLLVRSPATNKAGFSRPFFITHIFQQNPQLIAVRLGIAILLSGLVCFWLAWYLTHPVRQLREASLKLANGDLNVRIAHKMGQRRDEIADLGKDFDHMAQRLQQMVNSQKQLIQDVSHELRSPLARLQLALALAQKNIPPSTANELLRIEKETDRLEELVSQILTLARHDDHSAQHFDEYIDVPELLQHILDDANFEVMERACEVIFNKDIQPTLQANGELLHRAFENIVRNALKYTADNSHIFVDLTAAKNKPNWIKISICDTGIGVPEDQLDKLFDPFFRVAEARDRSSGGYGLGLAIAKRAIQYHGGHIEAKNRDAGGLCIEILLPTKMGVA